MSLTSFLKNKDVREKFNQEFFKPKISLKGEILAPPLTNHYSLVGTAFDYLMRFYLEYLNPRVVTKEWVTENVLAVIRWYSSIAHDSELYESEKLDPVKRKVIENFESNPKLMDFNLYKKIDKIVSNARGFYSKYLKTGIMNDEVIESAILLAQIDPIYRAGYIDENIGIIDDGDATDLENLISIVRPEFFKTKKLCILNPTFGIASQLVGSADADILIDNTLIDIKTTKDLKLDRKYFNQIIGYYILFKIGGINDVSLKPGIETLGIYYSRYGELYTISVKDVIDDGRLPAFIRWFEKRAADEQSIILQ